MQFSKKKRQVLRQMFGGKCAYCGRDLPEHAWEVDHDNLKQPFPSCRACHSDKNFMSLEDWRAHLEQKPEVLRRNYSAWRHAERFGLVAQVGTKVVFHFERKPGITGL